MFSRNDSQRAPAWIGVLAGLIITGLAGCASEETPDPGTVIVNARVIDGSGAPARPAAVRIVGDKIESIGDIQPTPADTIVDAAGLVLAPGFIDTHSHHEGGLDEMPEALAAVSQGVTTIAGGQDGGQPYPLASFFADLEAEPVAINVSAYAGHGTLRGEVMGEDYMRHATAEEVARMESLLRTELESGALGLSSGLEYDPGSFSSTDELIVLARVVAEYGGNYISHIRSEDQYFWEAVEEAIAIGRAADIPVRITHIKLAMTRWWGDADRLLATLDEARGSGVDVTADIYPYPMWNTSFSWLITLFPERDLDRRDGAEYVLNDMLSPEGIFLSTYFPEPEYNGMTIAEISRLRESDHESTLMNLLKAERDAADDAPSSNMLGFAMDEPDMESIMAWPHTVLGSDGELAGVHPRGYGAFTRYLGHYIRDQGVLSLGEGVRRMTSMPAEQVGIPDRGRISEGYYADLVLFDPATVQDRATPSEPHLVSTGIAKVWVNGALVFSDGAVTGQRPGMVIRRGGP